MSLIPYPITALAESDAVGTDGKNIVAGAVVTMTNSAGAVVMYDDAAGTNGSSSKMTGANGQVTVFVEPDTYTVSVNGSAFDVVVADNVPVEFDTFANATAASPQLGQRVIVRERANANYIVNNSAALAGDITFANGLFGSLQIDGAPHIDKFGGQSVQSLSGADSSFDNKDVFTDIKSRMLSDNYQGVFHLGSGYYRTTEPLDFDKIILIKGLGVSESYIHADHLAGPALRFRNENSGVEDLGVTSSVSRRAEAYVYGNTNFGILYETDDVIESSTGRNSHAVLNRFYLHGHPSGSLHVVGAAFTGSIQNFNLGLTNGHGISFDRGEATGRVNLITGFISGVCNVTNGKISGSAGHAITCGSSTSNFSTPSLRVIIDNIEGGNNATNPAILSYDTPIYLRGANHVFMNSAMDVESSDGCAAYVAGRNIRLQNNRMLEAYKNAYVIGTYDILPTNGIFISGMSIISPDVSPDPLILVTLTPGETKEPQNIFIDQGEYLNITSLVGTDATMDSSDYRRIQKLFINGSRPVIPKLTDQILNNEASYKADDELKIYLAPRERVYFTCTIEYGGQPTADIKLRWRAPAGATFRYSSSPSSIKVGTGDAITIESSTDDVIQYGANNVSRRVATMTGYCDNDTVAGYMFLQWAQVSAEVSDTTIFGGLSHLEIKSTINI